MTANLLMDPVDAAPTPTPSDRPRRTRRVSRDGTIDLAGAAIRTVTGGAALVVQLLALRDRLSIASERIGRSPAALRQSKRNRQRKDKTDEESFRQTPLHGFFSAAATRSGRPKVRMLVPDAIARY